MRTDKVFHFKGLVVSAFGEVTVQAPPFVARGNGGSGLVVLEPRNEMIFGELAYVAAYMNHVLRWRFSWYRQVSGERVKQLELPDVIPEGVDFPVGDLMPEVRESLPAPSGVTFRPVALESMFDLVPGNYHELNRLRPGGTPVVSCSDENNGIAGYFDVDGVHRDRLTVAVNGSPLSAKYHPYAFAAKDDVAVCVPRQPLRVPALLFIQVMLNRERWRYSYYRKCYPDKLRRFEIMLPVEGGDLNEAAMEQAMRAAPFGRYLIERLTG